VNAPTTMRPQGSNTAQVKGRQNRPFGQVERTIARRYLGAKKSEGGVAAIAVISFICITLAIVAMITIMSIMNGFRARLAGAYLCAVLSAEPDGGDAGGDGAAHGRDPRRAGRL